MEVTSFGKIFFLFIFVSLVACTITALAAQFISRGRPGGFGKIIVVLMAAAGSFLSCHWNDIGKFTAENWKHNLAIPSIVIETFMITLASLGIAESIYGKRSAKEVKHRKEKTDEYNRGLLEAVLYDKDEENCLQTLEKVKDEYKLADIAARAEKRTVALAALNRISNPALLDSLYRTSTGTRPEDTSLHFEIARRKHDPVMCSEVIVNTLKSDPDAALSYLATIDEKSFLESVLLKTLSDPENEGLIYRTSKAQVSIAPPFSKKLLLYCCQDGRLHDFETHIEVEDKGPADDDDMKAHRYSEYTIRTCKACGYQRIS